VSINIDSSQFESATETSNREYTKIEMERKEEKEEKEAVEGDEEEIEEEEVEEVEAAEVVEETIDKVKEMVVKNLPTWINRQVKDHRTRR
jgi:hypothetical protein